MITDKDHYFAKSFTILLLILIICMMTSGCDPLTETNKPDQVSDQVSDQKLTIAVDKETIQAMIDRAEPLIEEITGREYKSRIEFRIISREALRLNIVKESLSRVREWEKNMSENLIKRQYETSAQKSSKFYIGRYFKHKKVLYVIPENITAVKKLYKTKDEDLNDFLFIIIAHEMVHALDNQYYDLTKLLGENKNQEINLARSAVIGGSAAYITSILAEKLNISETLYKDSLKLDICIEDENEPVGREYYNLYYVKGTEFIRTMIDKKGLLAGYESAFTSPPVSTLQILFPEEYFSPPDLPSVESANLLNKVIGKLPVKEGTPSQLSALGAIALRTRLLSNGIKKEDADFVADNCLGGVSYLAFQNDMKPDFITVLKYALFKKIKSQGLIRLTILNFNNREIAAKYDEMTKINKKLKEDQFGNKPDTSYELLKEEEQKHKGFDLVRSSHFKDIKSNYTNTIMKTVGIIEGLYVAVEYINMKEKTEEDIMYILDLIYTEQAKMKQKNKMVSLHAPSI